MTGAHQHYSQISVQHNVMLAMRDGVCLATDIYRPALNGQPLEQSLPVIMERTPYGKTCVSRSERSRTAEDSATRPEIATWFARQGYVVVMQDCRGRYGSEGDFKKYVHEAEDGYDTLAWLVAQPWCNGKIGTMGVSYGAHVQTAVACLNPPGLATMFLDSGGFSSAYHGGIRRGGAFELKQATWAYKHALLSPATKNDPAREQALQETDIRQWFRNMPWRTGHSPLTAAPEYEDYLFEQWQAGTFTDYWQQPGLYAEGYYDQFPDIPVAIVGSWYDPYVLSCTRNYTELSARKQSPVSLLMGPWTHGGRSVSFAGDVDFGGDSLLDDNIAVDYRQLRLAWFDQYLRGTTNADNTQSAGVRYFQMGGGNGQRLSSGRMAHGGRWRQSASWPPREVTSASYYLHHDGCMNVTAPTVDNGYLEFRYDPTNPVPTIGGALTSGQPVMLDGAFDQRVSDSIFTYVDQLDGSPLSERDDVLVFQTPVLDEDLVVTGQLQAELWVSSDCPDTDFTVKLIDCYPPCDDYPDGYAMNITDGIFRVRYRDGWDRESFMQAGEVYRICIEPFATSNLFRKGHRLRIDISSSNYPHFDINPNTAEPVGKSTSARVANNRVWCSQKYPSRIRLPVFHEE
ncbi:MAG: CocE/NonD family hydrolase [Woeseia sp.]